MRLLISKLLSVLVSVRILRGGIDDGFFSVLSLSHLSSSWVEDFYGKIISAFGGLYK